MMILRTVLLLLLHRLDRYSYLVLILFLSMLRLAEVGIRHMIHDRS